MRVFISSITRGLEEERRALAGLIQALGHEPVRFEDFGGARTEPSRQECLEAVASSDVYLLLLGPYYGHVFPETGQSATHDEFVAARSTGIPRLVYRKIGQEPEALQAEFIALVSEYTTGSWRLDFNDATDLQPLVTQAIRELESAPSPLSFEPLETPPTVTWKDDWDDNRGGWGRSDAFVELHATSLTGTPIPARRMDDLPDAIITKLRTFGALAVAAGAEVKQSDETLTVVLPLTERRHDASTPHEFAGVRVARDGQVSVWTRLPHDHMGPMLDDFDLQEVIAEQLRVLGVLNIEDGERFALSAGIGGTLSMVSFAKPGIPRSQSTPVSPTQQPVRIAPDESVSSAAFDTGADQVARQLTGQLLRRMQR